MTGKELKEKLKSLKPPPGLPRILTQSAAVMQNKEYIEKRASGELVFLETAYEKLNKALMLEPNTMLTLTGLSGGGNVTIDRQLYYRF
tara:strand:- start:1049 stop:1312 length:264 start_codon:yes stop_codon:yes gene_type:complete